MEAPSSTSLLDHYRRRKCPRFHVRNSMYTPVVNARFERQVKPCLSGEQDRWRRRQIRKSGDRTFPRPMWWMHKNCEDKDRDVVRRTGCGAQGMFGCTTLSLGQQIFWRTTNTKKEEKEREIRSFRVTSSAVIWGTPRCKTVSREQVTVLPLENYIILQHTILGAGVSL
jgi:hypothetical protein